MLDLIASPNTIHFVVDQEIVETTISLNSSEPVEKRTMEKKKKRQLNKLHGITTTGGCW
jgi:hypothetical protein